MQFRIITLFPDEVLTMLGVGVVGRAIASSAIGVECLSPRSFATNRHRRVDDRPYGGGPGMVLQVEPMVAAIRAARTALGSAARVIGLSPQGRRFDHAEAGRLAAGPDLVLVAGRYEGIDERVAELEFDDELSLGDFVLSGGEVAALAVVDAVARRLPGVLGADESARQDSFENDVLDCPHYTRPDVVEGLAVPAVLMEGDHAAVRRWRRKQALGRTQLRRPDLLAAADLDESDRSLLNEFLSEAR